MKWSSYQQAVFDEMLNGTDNVVVNAVAGSGKCLAKGTLVLMYDGSLKPIEEITRGEYVMGWDSTPRVVISTTSGRSDLFEIVPTKGDSWVCNKEHILTLQNSVTKEIFDIPLKTYLEKTGFKFRNGRPLQGGRRLTNAKLFRSECVTFPVLEESPAIDPYLIGLWIGDGTTSDSSITSGDVEIHQYCENVARDYSCVYEWSTRTLTGRFSVADKSGNKLGRSGSTGKSSTLRSYLLSQCTSGGKKTIPNAYLTSSKQARLRLLAGLIDSDGTYDKGCYSITTVLEGLANQYAYVARSLGMAAYISKKKTSIKETGYEGVAFRVSISGELSNVPVLLKRKTAAERNQKKSVLRTGFEIHPAGKGEFYGFELSGDGRFLLGDFTVTHNSSTLRHGIEIMPKTVSKVYLAFNKEIVEEQQRSYKERRINAKNRFNLRMSTLNSFGYSALIAYCVAMTGKRPKMMPHKSKSILDKLIETDTISPGARRHTGTILELVRLAKTYGIVPKNMENEGKEVFVKDRRKNWLKIADKHSVQFLADKTRDEDAIRKKCVDWAREILDISVNTILIIDFEDQMYLPMVHDITFKDRYDVVLVDECQDLSAIQRRMIRKAMNPNGRAFFVGDPRQAIYGFRGADSKSVDRITEEFDCKELPLSITYRCPTRVVKQAKRLVKHIEAAPEAKRGVVSIDGTLYDDIVDYQVGDLILCRTNAPLIEVRNFIRDHRNVPVRLLKAGKFEADAVDLLQSFGEELTRDAITQLSSWRIREIRKLVKKGNLGKANYIDDMCDFLERQAQLATSCRTVASLSARISMNAQRAAREAKDKPAVLLSTIHMSKGMEADRVFILNPDGMPSPMCEKKWEMKQEKNLIYVAITRAKRELHFLFTSQEKMDYWRMNLSANNGKIKWKKRPKKEKEED